MRPPLPSRLSAVAATIIALGCAVEQPEVELLSPAEHLVRASMALRGVRPSPRELQAVRENPGWLEPIVDYYLSTPEFGMTIREMHAEQLLIGVDKSIYPAGFPAVGPLAGMDVERLNQSVVEAPLRLACSVCSMSGFR